MSFEAFPDDARDALDWTWAKFEPFVADLAARPLTADSLDGWMRDWTRVSATIEELFYRQHVATTVNTADADARTRYSRFMQDIYPRFIEMTDTLNRRLLESGLTPPGFDAPLQKIRAQVNLFREANLPLLSEESQLSIAYDEIIGAQTVTWDGAERTLSGMRPLLSDADRGVRERAWRAMATRSLADRDALNALWGKLLDVRQQIAHNSGFDNYYDYRWQYLGRFDYTPADAISFCDSIEAVVVPAATRRYEARRTALGLDTLRPWDLDVEPAGRPPLRPFTSGEELATRTEAIFTGIDPRLGGYIRAMRTGGLFDLDNRKGKAPGGYCIQFAQAGESFIFMNAVGTHDDVETMLHEAGHAFHFYEAAAQPYFQQTSEWYLPMEFAEVASIAMEFLASAYLSQSHGGFYTEADAARAETEHLTGKLLFWPYMAVVDAFQRWAYTHIDAAHDPAQCDAAWADLWRRFMPGVDYTGFEDWVATGWQRKLHIFQGPLQYIEYGLAQLGAAQIWANSLEDQRGALDAYLRALALGFSVPLPDLYAAAGARFAFDRATLGDAVQLMEGAIAAE